MSHPIEFMTAVFAARSGDPASREVVLKQVRERLKGFYIPRAGAIESSDLAQDASMAIIEALPDFRGESEAQFWSWTITIARTTELDGIRHRNRKKRSAPETSLSEPQGNEIPLVDPGDSPSRLAIRKESSQPVLAALGRLAPDEQEVIRLCHYASTPWPEVSRLLGRSEDALRKLFTRSMTKWRELIERGNHG
ncbi:MAG: sigma-70 family RNA polymerase sigma factor [Planctomycetaceae bacterium]|nr:sigma-70 family RNA polymerase sigma factor [Planctomycetaceae bacterium]